MIQMCKNVVVQENQQAVIHDEVKYYLDAWYVSAPEAMLRLLEKKCMVGHITFFA